MVKEKITVSQAMKALKKYIDEKHKQGNVCVTYAITEELWEHTRGKKY